MSKHLVLVGGGHAHMITLANLHIFREKGFEVSVIGPSRFHFYSGMGPGMLGTTYTPADIRFATSDVVARQGGRFIHDSVIRIDPDRKEVFLKSGKTLAYDVLSCNAGSFVARNLIVDDDAEIFTVKPIETLLAAQEKIGRLCAAGKITIGIVGGGPSSAEIAGNIRQLVIRRNGILPDIRIFSGNRFMARFPEQVRKLVRQSLVSRDIGIIEQGYVKTIRSGEIVLENGQPWPVDVVFLAQGVRPSPIFADSGLPTGPDGGLVVNRYLQCPKYPELFGGGDCIYFSDQPLDKVGVYAVRQNPVLFHNLLAALEGRDLLPFDPGGGYLLIFNLGENLGVLRKGWLTFAGKLAFQIKDWIDRRFMRKFQAMEK